MDANNPLDSDLDLIYHHNGSTGFTILIGAISILLTGGTVSFFAWAITKSLICLIITIPFFTFWLWHSFYRVKSSYKIYQDRIVFFSENAPDKVAIIRNTDIEQLRYEDELGDGYDDKVWLIYVYLKNNYTSDFKTNDENRVNLMIKYKNKVESIITILKFYQSQKKDIYIITKHKKINEALGLRNWNNP